MVQLSRPFQAVLAAVALFALVWFVALHRPGSAATSSGSSSSLSGAQSGDSSKPSHVASASRAKAAAPRATAHTRTAAHRRPASATTHRAPATATAHKTVPTPHRAAATAHRAPATAHRAPATAHRAPATAHKVPSTGHAGSASEAASVAADLEHGRTVMLLFWNPHASNDVTVHQQLGVVAHKLGRTVAAFSARASQVGQFGSITRDVQVYQTPTLLIVNPKRQVTTVTGLTDAYALEQTIREARG